MRLLIVGKNGFLARHVLAAAGTGAIAARAIAHDDPDLDQAVAAADAVVSGALHPGLRDQPYRAGHDFDRKIAALAAQAGTHLTMLSTRRVYPEAVRWGAREDAPADGDGTLYGDNKARSEAAVRASGARCTILRLSNVIGQEWGRTSFAGRLLTSLKSRGEIHFDMSPATRRDFLPVQIAAAAILRQAQNRAEGVFNLGSGFAVPCGDLAGWILQGFGGGRLVVQDDTVRDEFFLDMETSAPQLGVTCDAARLQTYCVELGRALRQA